MKQFLVLVCFSLSLSPIFSQYRSLEIENGYVLPINSDTIFGSKISVNGSYIYLYEGKKKIGNWQSKKLRDYGYIIPDGKIISSLFAATAFAAPTRKGIYLAGINLDTTTCFISDFEEHSNTIKVYFPDFSTRKITTKDVHSVMYYDNEGKTLWYDAIRLSLESYQIADSYDYAITVTPQINEFSRRLADGKIQLHYAFLRNSPNASSVYVVKKNYTSTLLYIEDGLLTTNNKNTLTQLFEDYPALIEKIHSKGYDASHISELVNEYNAFFKKE